MSYKEILKQVGITTVVVATATVTVNVGRDQWEKYQARNSAPPLPPPPPNSFGGSIPKSHPPSSTTQPQKLPTGGSLENSPCSEQTAAFLNCAFHNSADLLKCAQLAEGLKACRKLYKLEPEGGSWLPWKS